MHQYSTITLLFLYSCIISSEVVSQSDSTDLYELSLSQLSKIKITSSAKVPQSLLEIPSTIIVVTASEIRDKGYFAIEDVLSDLPGFQFRNIQGINSYIFQRGIPNQNNLLLVLIDGVQINELNSGGFYGGAQYNLGNIERIEILYGPASVMYGTNAISGIINIVTRSAFNKNNEFAVSFGSFNTSKIDFSYCYANEEKTFGILASGMYKTSEKGDLKDRAGDYNWSNEMENYENDYSFDLKLQTEQFILGTNILYKQASTTTLTKSVGTIYRDYGTSWNIRFINNYLKYNQKLSEEISLSSIIYNRNTTVLDNTIYSIVDTAQIGYYRPNNLTGFENVLNYEMNSSLALSGGVTIEYDQLAKKNSLSFSDSPNHTPPTPEKPEMLNDYLVSIFIEPRLNLITDLYLSGGVRYDNSSVYNQVLTPRAGIIYSVNDYILRCSYAEAFRAPKPWDYTDGIGNSSLLPERMRSFETAITVSLTNNYKVDLVGYRNILNDAITKQGTATSYKWVNNGEIKTLGAEFSLKYESQLLKSSLNYTFNQSTNEFGVYVPEISKHSGNLSITYSFDQYIRFNIRANYAGKRENTKIISTNNSNSIDPYIVFHGALSFVEYKGFNAQLTLNNIFDEEYFHTSNRDPERYRQPQRRIILSVGYVLNN